MLCVRVPRSYLPERRYACGVLMGECLGLAFALVPEERTDVLITLPGHTGELRLADGLFATEPDRWLTPDSLPREPLTWWNLAEATAEAGLAPANQAVRPARAGPPVRVVAPALPVIYGALLPSGRFCDVGPGTIRLGVDVLGSAFFMATRYEEAVLPERDAHGRFPARASLAARAGFLDRPVVNEYAEVLWWALNTLWPGLRRKERKGRFLLSHDVDNPLCTAGRSLLGVGRSAAGDLVRRADPALAVRRIVSYARTRRTPDADLCNNFDWIMAESEARGITSAFNFLTVTGPADAAYRLQDPFIRRLMGEIARRGHEVGLHTSYHSYADPEQIGREFQDLLAAAEAEGIHQPAWGGRQHYLRWANPVTWQGWEAAGLQYDSTVGYADQPGFRTGLCHEHPVFDLESRRTLRLRERPLVVMEVTLFEYLGLPPAAALERIVELRRRCGLFDGDFTLLWHNCCLIQDWERNLYRTVLDACT